jgi:hypothetical protein
MSVAKWVAASIIVGCFGVWFFTPLRSPINSQMVGQYRAEFPWGEALLSLNRDHSFNEAIHTRTGESQELTGKWMLDSGWPARVSLTPYWDLTQEGPKGKSSSSYLSAESRWIWGVHIDLASYGTDGFRKQ